MYDVTWYFSSQNCPESIVKRCLRLCGFSKLTENIPTHLSCIRNCFFNQAHYYVFLLINFSYKPTRLVECETWMYCSTCRRFWVISFVLKFSFYSLFRLFGRFSRSQNTRRVVKLTDSIQKLTLSVLNSERFRPRGWSQRTRLDKRMFFTLQHNVTIKNTIQFT